MAPTLSGRGRRVILDAGGAFALARHDTSARAAFRRAARSGLEVAMPTPVLAQVHRGGRGRAELDRLLQLVEFLPTSEAIARQAGELQAKTGTSDAIDAIVAAEALESAAFVLASDEGDLARLIDDEPGAERVAILGV